MGLGLGAAGPCHAILVAGRDAHGVDVHRLLPDANARPRRGLERAPQGIATETTGHSSQLVWLYRWGHWYAVNKTILRCGALAK